MSQRDKTKQKVTQKWCNAKPVKQGRNAGDLPHYVRTYKNISMIGRLSLDKCTSAKGKIPEGPWCVVVRNNRDNKLALLALGCHKENATNAKTAVP